MVSVALPSIDGDLGMGAAGLAGGVLDAAREVGTAVGLAVPVSLAVDRANGLLSAGADPSVAATSGFSPSFGAASGVLAAGALLALVAVRSRVASPIEDARPADEPR